MLGDPFCPAHPAQGRGRYTRGSDEDAWHPEAHPVGQWSGDGRELALAVAGTDRYEGRLLHAGGLWKNGYGESFNGKLGDELVNGEISYTLRETQALIELWRVHYNTIRPHSALGYRLPAPEIIVPGEELPMNHEAA